jgi:hypothetical protein
MQIQFLKRRLLLCDPLSTILFTVFFEKPKNQFSTGILSKMLTLVTIIWKRTGRLGLVITSRIAKKLIAGSGIKRRKIVPKKVGVCFF